MAQALFIRLVAGVRVWAAEEVQTNLWHDEIGLELVSLQVKKNLSRPHSKVNWFTSWLLTLVSEMHFYCGRSRSHYIRSSMHNDNLQGSQPSGKGTAWWWDDDKLRRGKSALSCSGSAPPLTHSPSGYTTSWPALIPLRLLAGTGRRSKVRVNPTHFSFFTFKFQILLIAGKTVFLPDPKKQK